MKKEPEHTFGPVSAELNKVGKEVVGAAFKVYKTLGPGLLEKIYEICFCHKLAKKGISFERQIEIPMEYDGIISMKD